jgi:hypothetical protein
MAARPEMPLQAMVVEPTGSRSGPVRWGRKMARALPAAATAFRRAVRSPLERPEVGSRIVMPKGATVGRVEEVIVGETTGRTTYAVADPRLPDAWILLIPSEALGRGENALIVLTDPSAPVAVPRDVAPAA